jgi:hypothetical protein
MEVYHYKIWFKETVLVPNTSMSLQTTLGAESHLGGGQWLFEE